MYEIVSLVYFLI